MNLSIVDELHANCPLVIVEQDPGGRGIEHYVKILSIFRWT